MSERKGPTITIPAKRYHKVRRALGQALVDIAMLTDMHLKAVERGDRLARELAAAKRAQRGETRAPECSRDEVIASYRAAAAIWRKEEAEYGHRIDALNEALAEAQRAQLEVAAEARASAYAAARRYVGRHLFTRAPGRWLVMQMEDWTKIAEEYRARRHAREVAERGPLGYSFTRAYLGA